MRWIMKQLAWLSVVSIVLVVSGSALAVVVNDENSDPALSNDRLNPSSFELVNGTNTLIGTTVSGDREYVHFSIAPGLSLAKIIMASYEGLDGTAFIGVQEGTTFTEPPTGTNPANLLGYTHFGPGAGHSDGDDLLPDIGNGFGSMGFVPPLTEEDYTFWIQQTGANATTYQLDFEVVPEPTSLIMLFGGLAMAWVLLVAGKRQ